MIYTLTCNPSIDYSLTLGETLRFGLTNRSSSEEYRIGGKGINLSLVLRELGKESSALGFAAGFTGEKIIGDLGSAGVDSDFVILEHGETRTNIKLHSPEGETEINAAGPAVSESDIERLLERLKKLGRGDILLMAGSLPGGCERARELYLEVAREMHSRGVDLVVDTTGKKLLDLLEFSPLLIKPNRQELCELFGGEDIGFSEVSAYADKLRALGAQNVIVSLGGDGALLAAADGKHYRVGNLAPEGLEPCGTVGAGDSMIAGFVLSLTRGSSYPDAFLFGAATATATVFSDGLAKRALVEQILAASQGKVEEY